jgi:hypothetical protein
MGTVTNLAEYRARKQPVAQAVAALVQINPTKEEIAKGVVARFKPYLDAQGKTYSTNSAIRMLANLGARAIVKKVAESGHAMSKHGRFQFFGVAEGATFHLLGRANYISDPEALGHYAALYLIDPATSCAFPLTGTDNIPKNNSFAPLITLPMSDTYNL